LSVAIVDESCDPRICEPAVLENLERSVSALAAAGARVSRVSLPIWARALSIFQPYIACLIAGMVRSEGAGYGHLGLLDPAGVEAFGRARLAQSADLPKQLKCWMVAERYLHARDANATYARLHNLRLVVREEISALLRDHDLLLTPTLPVTAPVLPAGRAPFAEVAARTSEALCFNTAPLNLSGHPAISIPSGSDASGLPTAVQLVAGHFDEPTAFRAAFELERSLGPFVP
jgi:amidase